MCRLDSDHHGPTRLLTLKAFYLNLKLSGKVINHGYSHNDPLCRPLTMVYLPRVNGAPLEVDGSSIRPESPAYITLHRVVNPGGPGSVVFGSLERVRTGNGARFEVYVGEEKLLKGKLKRGVGNGWHVECTCVLEREIGGVCEICVAVEAAGGEMTVEVGRRRRRRSGRSFGLEEIPEEECWCGWLESGMEGEDEEVEMEGGGWVVELGVWAVVCLGVGYLVSKASVNRLRRRRMLM